MGSAQSDNHLVGGNAMRPLFFLFTIVVFTCLPATFPFTDLRAQTDNNSAAVASEISSAEQQYYKSVLEQIMSNWAVPSALFVSPEDFVKVVIKVRNDGVIIGRRIEESSGIQEFNLLALKAIASSAPLPQFPDELTTEYVHIGIRFTKDEEQR